MALKNDPTYQFPTTQTPGGDIKAVYDHAAKGFFGKLWGGAKQVLDSNFGLGVVLMAAAIVTVMAVVPAWMATIGTLTIDGTAATAEHAALTGIGHALSYLYVPANPSALVPLGIGGFAGKYLLPKIFKEHAPLSVKEAQQKAKDLGLSPELEPGMEPDRNKIIPEPPEPYPPSPPEPQLHGSPSAEPSMYDKDMDKTNQWIAKYQAEQRTKNQGNNPNPGRG